MAFASELNPLWGRSWDSLGHQLMNFLVDTSAEVFIGQIVDLKEQQNVLEISQEHIEITTSLEDFYVAMNPVKRVTLVSYTIDNSNG